MIALREAKLPNPSTMGNAGSFFKNPMISLDAYHTLQAEHPTIPYYIVDDQHVKVPAAWLIDQCGLKGANIGGAAVHAQQPLVIVNQGGATAADVMQLAAKVAACVLNRFGIALEKEVIYV